MFAALGAVFSTPSYCCSDRRSLGGSGGGSGQQVPSCSLAPSGFKHLQALWNSPSYCCSDRKNGDEPWQQVEVISEPIIRLEKAAAPAAGATPSTQVSNSSGPPSQASLYTGPCQQAHTMTPEENGAYTLVDETCSNRPPAQALERQEVTLPEGVSMHDREGLYCWSHRSDQKSGDESSQDSSDEENVLRGALKDLREALKAERDSSFEDCTYISKSIKEALAELKTMSRVNPNIAHMHSSGSQLTLVRRVHTERSQQQMMADSSLSLQLASSHSCIVGSATSLQSTNVELQGKMPRAAAVENEDSDNEDVNEKWQHKRDNKESPKIKDIVDRVDSTVADIPVDYTLFSVDVDHTLSSMDVKAKNIEKSDHYKETCRENIEEYQSIVRERLKKLGIEEHDLHFHETQQLGAAVVDTILQYHRHCHDVGKPFAFLVDVGEGDGEGNEGDEMMERVEAEIAKLSDTREKKKRPEKPDKAKGRMKRQKHLRGSPRGAEGSSPSAEVEEPSTSAPSPDMRTLSERSRPSQGWTSCSTSVVS